MAAVMSTEMNNTDKVVMLVEESRAMKLIINSPNVNLGNWHFTVNAQGEIVYGLGAIKGVGESPVEALIEAREAGGAFTDLFDFCSRVDMKRLNKRSIDALIRSGALDELAPSRNLLLAALEDALKAADQANRNASLGMDDLFGGLSVAQASNTNPYAAYLNTPQWTDKQRLAGEKETLGLYLTGHPIDEYEAELKRFVSKKIANLQPSREPQRIAGLVMAFRTMRNKRGETLAFLTLDDRSGRLEVSIFGEEYERYKAQLTKDALLILEGEVREDAFTGGLAMRCKEITPIAEARSRFAHALELNFNEHNFDTNQVIQLGECLTKHQQQDGGLEVYLVYTCQLGKATLLPSNTWRVNPKDELLEELSKLLGKDQLHLVYLNEGQARRA